MSIRTQTVIEVLSQIKDKYRKDTSQNIRNLRINAVYRIVKERFRCRQTIYAHLVDQNSYKTLNQYEIDTKISDWLKNENNELIKWLLDGASFSDKKNFRFEHQKKN